MSDKPTKSAIESAYAYLANRMRTTEEVRKHLEGKGYDAGEIAETINELMEMRYLDDHAFAMRYYEYNREKRRGVLRAERELAEKGVDRETIGFAKEDFLYENEIDEFADALEIARREISLTDKGQGPAPLDDKLAAKIARKLETRGFARGDIFRVLDEVRRLNRSEQ